MYDLPAKEAIESLRQMRRFNLSRRPGVDPDNVQMEDDAVLRRVYELVGGRSSFLSRVARASNMIGEWKAVM